MMLEELQKYVTMQNLFALYPFVCVVAVAWCWYRRQNLYEGIAEGLGKYATFYAIFCSVLLGISSDVMMAFGFYVFFGFLDTLKGAIYFFRINRKKKKAGLWLCAFFVLLVYVQSHFYADINSIS